MKISDSQLYAVLANLLDGAGVASITPKCAQSQGYTAKLFVEVHNNHFRDSPDVILWLHVELSHPRLPPLKVKIPVPIEGEKAGIGAALEDLRKFSERERFPLSLPMLVVGGAGNPARGSHATHLLAKVEITQVPYRALSEARKSPHVGDANDLKHHDS